MGKVTILNTALTKRYFADKFGTDVESNIRLREIKAQNKSLFVKAAICENKILRLYETGDYQEVILSEEYLTIQNDLNKIKNTIMELAGEADAIRADIKKKGLTLPEGYETYDPDRIPHPYF